jgi:DNA-binding transcriptional LysR family regulator
MASLDNFRLVVFRAVAEQRSFRKAAEELYLTQPAVSMQIKALEQDVGAQLFDRTGAEIELTPAGRILLTRAVEAHDALAQAEQAIHALRAGHVGALDLGASTTIAQYVLPGLLGGFLRAHPLVQPKLISGNTELIVELLEKKKIGLGLIEGPARNRNVRTEPFLEDELSLLVPAGHEWAEREKIACSEIADARLLMRERGSGTRRVVELALEKHGVKRSALNVTMELDSTEAIKSAAEAGLGVGFISRWAVRKDLRLGQNFKLIEIEGVRIQREFCIAHLARSETQGLAQEFRRYLLQRKADLDGAAQLHRTGDKKRR